MTSKRNHFDKVCNGSLVKAFRKCGFDIDKVVFETDDSSSYDDLASLEAHIQEEDEKVLVKQLKKLKKSKQKKRNNKITMKVMLISVKLVNRYKLII